MELTLEDVKRAAKREDFRAGVQMRILMPRLSVHVTRWLLAHTRVSPNQITIVSLAIGLGAAAAFAATVPRVVEGEEARHHDPRVGGREGGGRAEPDRVTFPLLVFC